MIYLFENTWGWLLAALVCGAIAGWFTWSNQRRDGWLSGWAMWAAIAFVAALAIAGLRLFAGRWGLWVETALLFFASYIIGCFVGGWARAAVGLDAKATAPTDAVATAAVSPSVEIFGHDTAECYPGVRPPGLAAATGKADNLTLISGVTLLNEKFCNDIGVHHYSQIADWTPDNARWFDYHLTQPGCVGRERWIEQAKSLAQGKGLDIGAVTHDAVAATTIPAGITIAETSIATSALDTTDALQNSDTSHAAARSALTMAEAERVVAIRAAADKAEVQRAQEAHRAAAIAESARIDAARNAAVKADSEPAEAARLVAAKAEADRNIALKAASDKAEVDRLAVAGRVEADRFAAVQKADMERAEAARLSAAKVAADKTEADRLAALRKAEADRAAVAHPGARPAALAATSGVQGDDLKLIKGIGPKNEKTCNELGVYRFGQIAEWTPENATWVGHHMSFPGRIEREHWIPQAKLLNAGVDTDHSLGVKSGLITMDDSADAPLSAADASALQQGLPLVSASVDGEGGHSGKRPLGLAGPRGGKHDDLKRIRGIGRQNELRLHGLGIWHFFQVAGWTAENVKWAGSYLSFPGRIDREEWISQAKALAAGIETEFSKRVAAGLVPTSKNDASGQGNKTVMSPEA